MSSISISAVIPFFPHLLVDPFFAYWYIFGEYFVFIWTYGLVLTITTTLIRFMKK